MSIFTVAAMRERTIAQAMSARGRATERFDDISDGMLSYFTWEGSLLHTNLPAFGNK